MTATDCDTRINADHFHVARVHRAHKHAAAAGWPPQGVYFLPLDVGYALTSLHSLDCAASPSESLAVTSVSELGGEGDKTSAISPLPPNTPHLFYLYARMRVCVCAGAHSHSQTIVSQGFRRTVYDKGDVLSRRCPSTLHLQYLSEERSASAFPVSQLLSLIRDSGPKPIQLMCSHNAPHIHLTLHPFTPPL